MQPTVGEIDVTWTLQSGGKDAWGPELLASPISPNTKQIDSWKEEKEKGRKEDDFQDICNPGTPYKQEDHVFKFSLGQRDPG